MVYGREQCKAAGCGHGIPQKYLFTELMKEPPLFRSAKYPVFYDGVVLAEPFKSAMYPKRKKRIWFWPSPKKCAYRKYYVR